MLRIVFFLVAVAVAAFAAAWLADQSGDVVLTWSGWRADLSLPVFVLGLAAAVVAAIIVWTVVLALWRMPGRLRRGHHEQRHARGRHAITQGLLAIGMGDAEAARRHSQAARRDAHQDPLALLLHAQTAQIEGDRDGARRAFRAMAERDDTRLLGLRGLFVEAQRADDLPAAVAIAEEALRIAPSSPWAAHAVLGFRCSSGDWNGALAILEARLASGRIDKAVFRRERGVLLTARALDLETSDRDASRDSALEAVKLAPTLVPAAVLAAKFLSEAHQIRRAMRILETAWLAQPHPDLAEAYAHVRLGNSARQRLTRVETLAAKVPGHVEGALAIARQAIDAKEFARAREVLAPLIAAPTQRVAMLMAEIERAEHGDDGRARGWMLKALRAAHDPVWTADGYVSERWRAVSPVTGRLDAFQWQTPLAALPSDRPIDAEADRAISAPRAALPAAGAVPAAGGQSDRVATAPGGAAAAIAPAPSVATAQDNAPPPAVLAGPDAGRTAAPPLFRGQSGVRPAPAVPPVIPIVRAPDDPGVDDTEVADEFGAAAEAPPAQRGGWRGFLSRFGA